MAKHARLTAEEKARRAEEKRAKRALLCAATIEPLERLTWGSVVVDVETTGRAIAHPFINAARYEALEKAKLSATERWDEDAWISHFADREQYDEYKPFGDAIVMVSAARASTGEVFFSSLVNCEGEVWQPKAREIATMAGMDFVALKKAPHWPEVWAALLDAIAERGYFQATGWNCSFDDVAIRSNNLRHGVTRALGAPPIVSEKHIITGFDFERWSYSQLDLRRIANDFYRRRELPDLPVDDGEKETVSFKGQFARAAVGTHESTATCGLTFASDAMRLCSMMLGKGLFVKQEEVARLLGFEYEGNAHMADADVRMCARIMNEVVRRYYQ